jgi:hypothetical protein
LQNILIQKERRSREELKINNRSDFFQGDVVKGGWQDNILKLTLYPPA